VHPLVRAHAAPASTPNGGKIHADQGCHSQLVGLI
jgi:hypothetical protein